MTNTTSVNLTHAISVAQALLDWQWPDGPDLAEAEPVTVIALDSDPRYVIGRLQQALTILLASDLPPMDTQTALLSQAIADAIAWRRHKTRPCPNCAESLCGPCNADWDQADRYHALARALGAVGEPRLPPTSEAREPARSPEAGLSKERSRPGSGK
jgi:hypothetical protein